jgi:hypothetical protein
MRRKEGALVPLEVSILVAGLSLFRRGEHHFHGYAVASEVRNGEAARRLTAHGTLYRALERLEQRGLLTSKLEDPAFAAAEKRPRRRLYTLTAEGQRLAVTASAFSTSPALGTRPGLAPQ